MRFKKRLMFGGLILGWLAMAWSGWLPRPTDVQRKSTGLLEGPPMSARGERNAFAALWLSPYDVLPSEREGMMQSDLMRYRSQAGVRNGFQPGPEGVRPNQLPTKEEGAVLCKASQSGCLATIRHGLDAARTVLARHAALLERLRALSAYDHVHYLFPPRYDSPIPALQYQGALMDSDAALRFVDGDKAEGMTRACAATVIWRRFALHSDQLIVQMVAVRYFMGAATLVGEMLAEWPLDAPLPSACEEAFAPMDATAMDLCDSLRAKYVSNKAVLESMTDTTSSMWNSEGESRKSVHFGRALVGTALKFVLHPDGAAAMTAPTYAAMCTSDSDVHVEAIRLSHDSAIGYCGMQGELFNPLGCYMAHVSNPDALPYSARYGMLFVANRLLRASLDLRESAGKPHREHDNAAVSRTEPSDVVEDSVRRILSTKRSYVRPDESQYLSIPMPASALHR